MLRFEPPQLDHERVELGVADLRLVEDVVEMLVAAELGAQVRRALPGGVGGGSGHRSQQARQTGFTTGR